MRKDAVVSNTDHLFLFISTALLFYKAGWLWVFGVLILGAMVINFFLGDEDV